MKNFIISGLPMEAFVPLFKLTDEELKSHNAKRCIADSKPGFPCRVSLIDAEPGETVLLLPYMHHNIDGPYQSSGPIYVRENAKPVNLDVNELPEVVKNRLMSVRAYSKDSLMLASAVVEGPNLVAQIAEFFANDAVAYLHLHNAKPGCFSCRVDRAQEL
jgi:hypothetical protein